MPGTMKRVMMNRGGDKKKKPVKMNRGGDKLKMKKGGGAKKKRGMARGCGAATKGKGYNK
jgi:hypothetical protein|tara:strand:- start:26 stop:205 length:180 start_codon:yes stop_codon:yes gene_type:complete